MNKEFAADEVNVVESTLLERYSKVILPQMADVKLRQVDHRAQQAGH